MQKDLADAFLLPRALAHTCTSPPPPAPLPQLAEWLVKKKKKRQFLLFSINRHFQSLFFIT